MKTLFQPFVMMGSIFQLVVLAVPHFALAFTLLHCETLLESRKFIGTA
jgi:hypothetical protein